MFRKIILFSFLFCSLLAKSQYQPTGVKWQYAFPQKYGAKHQTWNDSSLIDKYYVDSIATKSTAKTPNNLLKFNYVGGAEDTIPLLRGSVSGWDQFLREIGNTIKVGNTYIMTYAGYHGVLGDSNMYVGLATSTDMVTWTKINAGLGAGKILSRPSEAPFIVYNNGTYFIYVDDQADIPLRNIRLFTSTNLTTWADQGDVIDTGSGWESERALDACVIVNNGTWYMYYAGYPAVLSAASRIGLATSTDGIHWTKYGGNPIIGGSFSPPHTLSWGQSVVADDIVKIDSAFYMTLHSYTAHPPSNFNSGMVVSKDLITWRDYLGGQIDVLDSAAIGTTIMFFYDSVHAEFKAYYTNELYNTAINYGYFRINPLTDYIQKRGGTMAGQFASTYTSLVSSPALYFSGTWFTGGTATTTKPHILIEPTGTTSTAWSTAGTGLGINAASGFLGNTLDLKLNNVSKIIATGAGQLNMYQSAISNGKILFASASGAKMWPWLEFTSEDNTMGVYFDVNKSTSQSALTGYSTAAYYFESEFTLSSGNFFRLNNNGTNLLGVDYAGQLDVGSASEAVATGGAALTDVGRISARYYSTLSSGFKVITSSYGNQTVATSGSIQGLEGFVHTSHTSGTVALAIGSIGNAEHTGTATTTVLRGMQAGVSIRSSGGGTDAAAYYAAPSGRVGSGSGTYTNGYGLLVGSFGSGFTNKYGIYVTDATASNYFAGLVNIDGAVTGGSFIKSGGTSSQILLADGSVSTGYLLSATAASTYLTTATAASTYLPLSCSSSTLTGNLLFTDNTYDIGASGATRPRNGYFKGDLVSYKNSVSNGSVSITTGDGSKMAPWFYGISETTGAGWGLLFSSQKSASQSAITGYSTYGALLFSTEWTLTSGNLVNFANNYASVFKVNYAGDHVMAGKITTYNNIATTGNGVPSIYGSGRSTAQTAAVASVTTYTVAAADASFQISANVNVTTSSAEAFTVTCTYTDETNTSRTVTMPFILLAGTTAAAINFANGAVPYEGLPFHIRCKAATAITIATTGTFTGATYNVEGNIIKTN